MNGEPDGLGALAVLLGASTEDVERALGRPWSSGERGSTLWGEFTIFTGRENPRTPGRPLIAIVVDHTESTVEVGHAVGVPLPDGRMRWTLGAPRTLVPLGEEALRDWADEVGNLPASSSPEALLAAMLAELRAGIDRVADTAMLRGIDW